MARATGRIEVIEGPMFAGKTDALIRRLARAEALGTSVVALKPRLDSRGADDRLVSHSGAERAALAVADGREAKMAAKGFRLVGIDEAQFFDDTLVDTLRALRGDGAAVIVAGLDLDFRGQPFGPMVEIAAIADHRLRLYARCGLCGRPASLSQRLRGAGVAAETEETIVLGGADLYSPRCAECFENERSGVLAAGW